MSDGMPIEQAEFIDTLQRLFNESTNMCHEDCYNLAFIIWQSKEYLSKMLGYEKGRADAINEINNREKNIPYSDFARGFKSGYEKGQMIIEEHDAKVKADAIEKCAEIISKTMRCESCPVDCLWGAEQKCKDTLALYLKTQIEEQENG